MDNHPLPDNGNSHHGGGQPSDPYLRGQGAGGDRFQQPSPGPQSYAQQQQQQHQHQQPQRQPQAPPSHPPPPGAAPPAAQQGPPQLPPQLFTTAAQLLDLTDKKIVLILRDGRKMIGVLRSWDQFANIVLQNAVERLYAGNLYAEIPRGVYLVRGENVLLLGEIDLDKEDDIPENFQPAPVEEVLKLKNEEDSRRKRGDKKKNNRLQDLGFEPEHSGEILF